MLTGKINFAKKLLGKLSPRLLLLKNSKCFLSFVSSVIQRNVPELQVLF